MVTPAAGFDAGPPIDNSSVIEQLIRDLNTYPMAADLLVGLIGQQMRQNAEHVPSLWSEMRSLALTDAKEFVNTEYLHNSAVITADTAGTAVGFGSRSPFDRVNILGGSAGANPDDHRQLDVRVGGGGADCMFDYLVSSCFSALDGFTEGMTFTSLSGCTFTGWSTFQLLATELNSNGGGGTVYLCGITDESVTLTFNPAPFNTLYVYGSGRTVSGITGTLTVSGQGSTSILEFYDVKMPTLTIAGLNTNLTAHRCWFGTVNHSGSGTLIQSEFEECRIDTYSASGQQNLFLNCHLSTFTASGAMHRVINCDFPTTGTLTVTGGNNHQIKGNKWAGSGTATTPVLFSLTFPNYSLGNVIEGNKFPAPPGSGAIITMSGTGGPFTGTINGNTFPYAGGAGINFIRAPVGAGVSVTGNSFEPRNTTPTYAEDDGNISISGIFFDSTFGLNTPADFDLEALAGSVNNLYIGLGTVSGAGATGVTIVPGGLAPNDGKFLTYADDFANLPSSEIWTPGSGLQGSGTPGSTYTAKLGDLTETWQPSGAFDILLPQNIQAVGYGRVGSLTAPTNNTAGDFTAERFFVNDDPVFSIYKLTATVPVYFFDSGDYLAYNRTTNVYSFNIASALALTIRGTSISSAGPMRVGSNSAPDASAVLDLTSPQGAGAGLALLAPRFPTTAQPGTPLNGLIYYDSTTNKFVAYENGAWANMINAGGAALTVQEEDGTPIDTAVTIIRVPNGGLTDNGVGDVSLGYELAGAVATHTGDATDAHDASAISIADAGGLITATEVEGALQELAAVHYAEVTITVENPTASENIPVRQFTQAITITAIQAVVIGGTSVTIDPEHGSTITTATKLLSAAEVVASSSTTGEHIGGTGTAMAASFNDATLAAGDFLRLETTAISGTPTLLSVTFKYRLT